MIKVLNLYFPGRLFFLLATENAIIFSGVWLALLTYEGSFGKSLQLFPKFLLHATMVTVICQLCMYYADLYDLRFLSSWRQVLRRLLQAAGSAALILALIIMLFPATRIRFGVFELSLTVSVLLLFTGRIVMERFNRLYGIGQRMVMVGTGKAGSAVAREIRTRSDIPIRLLGCISEGLAGSAELPGLESLGDMDRLTEILAEVKPDLVVFALSERRNRLPMKSLLRMRMSGIKIEDANALYENLTGRIPVESIHPSHLIFSDGFRGSAANEIAARVFGAIGGGLGFFVTLPIMALVAAAVRLESKGPALFAQERVGKNGKTFWLYKFRSMRIDAEAGGPVWAVEKDPRVTKVGRVIRTLRLDELPQFFNVLRGDMSFVGPRPERPHFVKLLSETIPYYDLRHTVRPGLTGWAQIRASYSSTVEESKEKFEYDLFYIKNCRLSLDLLIIFSTIKTMIFGRGAR
jgi:sugar transferase (PEP-CTERM system associated)